MEKIQKSDMFEYMFETLCENRMDDLVRAVEARNGFNRKAQRSKNILSYYKRKVGSNIEPLTEEEMNILKETWKDIWDLGVIHPDWYSIQKTKTGVFDPTIIGTDLHYYYTEFAKIDFDYLRGFLDKNYGDIILPCIKHPKVYLRKVHGVYRDENFKKVSIDAAVNKLLDIKAEGAVVKIATHSSGGKGVDFITADDTDKSIREKLSVHRDIVVQEIIKQHEKMQIMNPSSVNTLRIICIMLDGESIPLSTVVRIGKEGSKVDNFSSGGYACGVNADGTLKELAFDSSGNWFDAHSNGFIFKEGRIPNYEKVLEIVKQCHDYVSIFGVVSWDIAITEDGEPILIEYNVGQGQIDLHQYCNGPVYGEYREQIIKEVFNNYAVRNGNLNFNYSIKNGECIITKGSKTKSEIIIPEKLGDVDVRRITDSAFSYNNNLKYLSINTELNRIDYCAFYNCKKLVSINFEKPVIEFGRSCFNTCSSLETVFLPEGTKKICTMAFRNCGKLKLIYIPDSVEEIEPKVFLESPNVTILCKKDSTAYHYAIDNNISYSII